MTAHTGFQAMITQHAWMFLSSFEKMYKRMMLTDTINMIHLGARAFEEIGRAKQCYILYFAMRVVIYRRIIFQLWFLEQCIV